MFYNYLHFYRRLRQPHRALNNLPKVLKLQLLNLEGAIIQCNMYKQ